MIFANTGSRNLPQHTTMCVRRFLLYLPLHFISSLEWIRRGRNVNELFVWSGVDVGWRGWEESPPPAQPDWGNMQKCRGRDMYRRWVKRKFYLIHVACTVAGKKDICSTRGLQSLLLSNAVLSLGLPESSSNAAPHLSLTMQIIENVFNICTVSVLGSIPILRYIFLWDFPCS
jgi:hypothetical protein